MAYHIPFEHRRRPPVYIGFDVAARSPRPKFNWWGFGGLMTFLLSFGVLSPIALIMSAIGLRRPRRGLAVVGTVLSLIGTGVIALGIAAGVHDHNQRMAHVHQRQHARLIKTQVADCRQILASAEKDIEEFKAENDGLLPSEYSGMLMMVTHKDSWKNELRYEVGDAYSLIRSAGPDGEFDNDDDVTRRVIGKAQQHTLIPIDH